MLSVKNLSTFYGKIQALWDVSFEVREGEIVALVGANGAGKTTLLNTISGIVRRTSGTIEFLGQPDRGGSRRPASWRWASPRCPRRAGSFPDMTVRENLEMGAYQSEGVEAQGRDLRTRFTRYFHSLKERSGQIVRTLSGGEKQMVAIGRGLMSRPKLCMFDEPSYGLAPKAVAEIFTVIRLLPEQGITVLLVEQNVKQALEMADRACVLENGRLTLEGPSRDLIEHDHVRKAYLGL